MANTRRENRTEELGRVDAEKADTKKGKKNLWAEKKRIRKELKAKTGTMVKAKKGFGKKLVAAATAAGAAYLASKHLKGAPGYKNVHETKAVTQTPGSKWGPWVSGKTHTPKKKIWRGDQTMTDNYPLRSKGGSIKAKTGTMIKAKKGFGKKLAKAAAVAGAAYLASKHLGKPQGYKNVHETGAITKTPGRWKNVKYPKDIHPGTTGLHHPIKEKAGDLYSGVMGMSKKGGSIKARTGKMVKARGGAYIKTKLNGTLFTRTF